MAKFLAALATCSELQTDVSGEMPVWLPVLPPALEGVIQGHDGRTFRVENIYEVIQATIARGTDTPIDIAHTAVNETEQKLEGAIGWVKSDPSSWHVRVDGSVWAYAPNAFEPHGREVVKRRSHKYISPAFYFRPDPTGQTDGIIREFAALSLVTKPNLDLPALNEVAINAVWSTAYVNDLPDSAFLYVEKGGEKDETGKTKPRSLRHFPYKDSKGNIDLPHLRNAIARIPQSKIPGLDKEALQEKARRILAGVTNTNSRQEESGMDPKELRIALGLAEDATEDEVKKRVAALSEATKTGANPVETALNSFREEVKTLISSAVQPFQKNAEDSHEKLVTNAIDGYVKAGKIQPNETAKKFWSDKCKTPVELKATCEYLDQLPPLVSTQARDMNQGGKSDTLSEQQKEVCSKLGVDQERFKKTQPTWLRHKA